MEKTKSKLRGSCSSNLTRFQLNRRKFVFFTRGGSKLFTPNHFVNCALICPSILENWFGPILQQLFGRSFTKKPHLGHSKNGKWLFCAMKVKTPLGNIVWNSKMHPCAQYEIIWTNYATNVAISLIICLESHESWEMIAHFWEHFLTIISVLQVYYFSWKLGHI